jgi:hypothetical protein
MLFSDRDPNFKLIFMTCRYGLTYEEASKNHLSISNVLLLLCIIPTVAVLSSESHLFSFSISCLAVRGVPLPCALTFFA